MNFLGATEAQHLNLWCTILVFFVIFFFLKLRYNTYNTTQDTTLLTIRLVLTRQSLSNVSACQTQFKSLIQTSRFCREHFCET